MGLGILDQSWQLRAGCRGPESALFFPPSHTERRGERGVREARAKSLCRTCEVRAECLGYALQIEEPHGIWGGLTESERRSMISASSRAASAAS